MLHRVKVLKHAQGPRRFKALKFKVLKHIGLLGIVTARFSLLYRYRRARALSVYKYSQMSCEWAANELHELRFLSKWGALVKNFNKKELQQAAPGALFTEMGGI